MCSSVELARWFLTPLANQGAKRGFVRVWGFTNASNKVWRSSSITERRSSRELVTRYGTVVALSGPLDEGAAKKARMTSGVAKGFRSGFPREWQRLVRAWIHELRKKTKASEKARLRNIAKRGVSKVKKRARTLIVASKEPHISVGVGLASPSLPTGVDDDLDERPNSQPNQSQEKQVTILKKSFRKDAPEKSLDTDPQREVSASQQVSPVNQNKSKKESSRQVRPRRNVSKPVYDEKLLGVNAAMQLPPALGSTHRSVARVQPRPKLPDRNIEEGPQSVINKQRKPRKGKPRTNKGGRKRVGFQLPEKEEVQKENRLQHEALSPENSWTREQKRAYEVARSTISADAEDYWELVAAKVEGKTAEECCQYWEAQWDTPRRKSKRPTERLEQTTPEIAHEILTGKRSKSTAKYTKNIRKIVAAINRDSDDAEFEPCDLDEISSQGDALPQTPGSTAPGNCLSSALKMGTPGTEVRAARAEIDKAGYTKTPEILARGRSFGLAEADQYVALFQRRTGLSKMSSKSNSASEKVSASSFTRKSQAPRTPVLGRAARGRYVPVDDLAEARRAADANGSSREDTSDDELELCF